MKDLAFYNGAGNAENTISSIKLVNKAKIELYPQAGYGGNAEKLERSTVDLTNQGINDQVSSIKFYK